MKIKEALKEAQYHQTTISSPACNMYQMRLADLGYWLFVDLKLNDSKELYELIQTTEDWELDEVDWKQLELFNKDVEGY